MTAVAQEDVSVCRGGRHVLEGVTLRVESSRTVAVAETAAFAPLPPPAEGAVPLTLTEFITRAYYDTGGSISGVPVRLTGFVVADPDVPDGYQLARFTLSCCAADAFPMKVAVRGVERAPPPDDTWVEVTGTWLELPEGADGVERGAQIELTAAVPIPQPENPYE